MNKIRSYLSVSLSSIFIATSMHQSVLADPPAGRLLASHCAQCHGTNGNAVSGMDPLAGESVDELYGELLEMKYRAVPDDIMHWQARGYTDEQLLLISEYYAAQPSTGSGDSDESDESDESE